MHTCCYFRCFCLQANYSIDENLYHTSYESGMLEDPACPAPESMFKMTVSPEAAPDKPEVMHTA
jgi:argininosuccinate synthase